MANIKELLANMIGKINGKLNAPEQAAHPHQQLVTDADGVAKWEDRLAYSEDCEIIHRQTVSCELKEGSLYGSTVDGHLTDEIVGKSLKVVFDGVEYECEAVKFSGVDGVYLGNTSLIGAQGGNGEPFIIFDQGNCVIGVSEPGEYEICILESHIKTIDPKYLPDGGSSPLVITLGADVNTGKFGFDTPFQEAWDALEAGRPVFAYFAISVDTRQAMTFMSSSLAMSPFGTEEERAITFTVLQDSGNNAVLTFYNFLSDETVEQKQYQLANVEL